MALSTPDSGTIYKAESYVFLCLLLTDCTEGFILLKSLFEYLCFSGWEVWVTNVPALGVWVKPLSSLGHVVCLELLSKLQLQASLPPTSLQSGICIGENSSSGRLLVTSLETFWVHRRKNRHWSVERRMRPGPNKEGGMTLVGEDWGKERDLGEEGESWAGNCYSFIHSFNKLF